MSECKGALLILKMRKTISEETFARMFALVDRICAMLYKLSHPD